MGVLFCSFGCVSDRGRKLKFVERVEGRWLGRTPVSIARAFALLLLFFPIVFAEAAVETSREDASGYSVTQIRLAPHVSDLARDCDLELDDQRHPDDRCRGDVLDPLYQYQAGTSQVDNSISEFVAATCTPAEEQTIFTLIDATPFLSDAVDGDVASYTAVGTTIDAGGGTAANAQLNINGDLVWAILFSVKMP